MKYFWHKSKQHSTWSDMIHTCTSLVIKAFFSVCCMICLNLSYLLIYMEKINVCSLLEYFCKKKIHQFQENSFVMRHVYTFILVQYERWWQWCSIIIHHHNISSSSIIIYIYHTLPSIIIHHHHDSWSWSIIILHHHHYHHDSSS